MNIVLYLACVVVGVVGATDLLGSDVGGAGVCGVSCVAVDCTSAVGASPGRGDTPVRPITAMGPPVPRCVPYTVYHTAPVSGKGSPYAVLTARRLKETDGIQVLHTSGGMVPPLQR